MQELLIYFLKVNVWLFLVWLIYKLLLSKHTFHQLKRWYLVLGVVLSLVVPALSWQVVTVIPITIAAAVSEDAMVLAPAQPLDIWMIIYICVLAVLVLCSIRAGFRLWKAVKSLSILTNSAVKVAGMDRVYMSEKVEVPFSTNRKIYIHPDLPHAPNLNHILLHEEKHIADQHGIDIWLLQLLNVFFSYNPIVKRLLQEVKLNHEFIVDDFMMQTVDPVSYQLQLIQFQHKNFQIDLANQFAFSNLKQRIIFMNTTQSSKWKWSSLLLGAMILGATSFAMAYENVTVYEITEQHINKDTTKQPLMLVNGKKYEGDINTIDPQTIASVNVYKNDEAIKKYGKEGEDGVVDVTLKTESAIDNKIPIKVLPIAIQIDTIKNQKTPKVSHDSDALLFEKVAATHKFEHHNNHVDTFIHGFNETFTVSLLESNDDMRKMINQTILDQLKKPNGKENPIFQKVTYIVDGKECKDISAIDPNNIASVNVVNLLKPQENSQKGVIEITLKK